MSLSKKFTSPASVPLPVSPQNPRGEFDALIDLFSSDESPVGTTSGPNVDPRSTQTDLRDIHGQLDFSKIKSLFASSNSASRARQEIMLPSKTEYQARPVQATATVNNDTIDSRVFEAISPPAESTPIHATHALRGDRNVAMASPPWNTRSASNDVPLISTHEDMTSFFLDLKEKLDSAHREVMDLRQRCFELENLHPQGETQQSQSILEMGWFNPSALSPQLRGYEAHNSSADLRSSPTSEDIHRSLEMVNFVDELVWKRSRFGAKYENPYGAENIQGLRERLEVWERAIRTRRR